MVEVASRKTRPEAHLVRRSKAKAPEGFNRQRPWRLKIISLVPQKQKNRGDLTPLHSLLQFRHQRLIGLDTHPNPVDPDRLRPHRATPLQPALLRKLQIRPMTLLPLEPFANS